MQEEVVQGMKEQQRITESVRQRQLVALDLFLESSRKQLQHLMTQSPADSAPPDTAPPLHSD
jgi:hypothetical protein